MKQLITLLVLGFYCVITFGWSAHEVLTYLLVKDFLPNSDKLIQITPYNYDEKRGLQQGFSQTRTIIVENSSNLVL